jgi:hypothetical protein
MPGILKIACKLLINDKAKFSALLVGITFAVLLLFAGVINRASATVINIGASIWVMDPAVQNVANSFYVYHTGLGINLMLMTVISFIAGLSISGQTFYAALGGGWWKS